MITTRKDFHIINASYTYQGPKGKCTVHLSTNYRCLDTYGPDQRVDVLGYLVTLFHPDNSLVQVSESVDHSTPLGGVVYRLHLELFKLCPHTNSKRTSTDIAYTHRHICQNCEEVWYSGDGS